MKHKDFVKLMNNFESEISDICTCVESDEPDEANMLFGYFLCIMFTYTQKIKIYNKICISIDRVSQCIMDVNDILCDDIHYDEEDRMIAKKERNKLSWRLNILFILKNAHNIYYKKKFLKI